MRSKLKNTCSDFSDAPGEISDESGVKLFILSVRAKPCIFCTVISHEKMHGFARTGSILTLRRKKKTSFFTFKTEVSLENGKKVAVNSPFF